MGRGVHQRELVHIQALYHAGKRAYSAGPRTAPCAQSSRLKLRPWTTILQDEHAFLSSVHAEISSFNLLLTMRSPMRSPILPVILLSSASLIIAEEPAKEFWWSYAPENYTETARYGYDASFEVCGSSCSECREDAKQCWAEDYSNICYEPAYGETCCQDVYGTACVEGYYCAYNNTGVAYCCADVRTILPLLPMQCSYPF